MPPLRDKNGRSIDEAEILDSEDIELLDDSDIVDVDEDIEQAEDSEEEFLADDEIVESLDDEIVESLDDDSTGELEVDPGEISVPSVDEDPLSSFAQGPARQQEVEEYVGSSSEDEFSEESEESFLEPGDDKPEDTTYRVDFPESASESDERAKTQSSAAQMIFDPEDLSDADWQDDSEETPGLNEFVDTGVDTDDHENSPDWSDDIAQTHESEPDPEDKEFDTRKLLPPEGLEDQDVEDSGELESDLNWSSLDTDDQPAIPDIGETRVEQQEPVGPALDEKTLIFEDDQAASGEADALPERPLLLVVKGEDEGREIELNREELTLGRGPENDLVFADIACSRRHAMIEFDGENWFVSDLSSGNGTLLNGEKVTKEILYDGDKVEVGSTVLQFIWPDAPDEQEQSPVFESPASAPVMETVANAHALTETGAAGFLSRITSDPKQKKILLIVSASFGGLILLMLILKLILPSGPEEPTQEQILRQKQLDNQRQFEKHLAQAKELVQKKEWKGALLEIQLAKKFNPDSQIAKEYQEDIRKERSASSALDQSHIAMESKQWDVAMAALNRIDKESEYATEAQRLKREIEENLISDLLNKGLKFMKDGKYNQAMVKFNEVMQKDPDNTQIDELRRDCQREIDLENRRLSNNSRRKRHRRKRRRSSSGIHRTTGSTTGQVLALYKNMEIDRAIRKAEERGDSRQTTLLRKFRSKYNRGMRQSQKTGMAKDTVNVLSAALSLDQRISGGKGKYHDSIVRKLAKVSFILGMENFNRRKFPASYTFFRKVLKYNPGDSHAKKMLVKLDTKAKTLYENAYVLKATNPQKALEYLNTVIGIVSPRNIYYGKAKRLLKRLRPAASYDDSDSGF